MKLRDWQIKNKIRNKELADMLKVDPSYITLLRKRGRNPSLDIATKIVELTKGQVTFKDLQKNA